LNKSFWFIEHLVSYKIFVISILMVVGALYTLAFRKDKLSQNQILMVALILVCVIAVLGLFIYLSIGFNSMSDYIPVPMEKQ
jgi:multisubunit Na+/H+ antiporter MnhB subunit